MNPRAPLLAAAADSNARCMAKEHPEDPREQHQKPPYPEQTQPHPGSDAQLSPRADHGHASYKGFDRLRDRTPLIPQSFSARKVSHFGESHPMERPAQPAELSPAFVFLASDESRYVNGEILGVTGGKPLG